VGLLLRAIARVLSKPDVIDDIHITAVSLLTNRYDLNIARFRNLPPNP
jgi:hypothetical protein